MKKEEFIKLYIINFISSYTAKNYDSYCSQGRHQDLNKPPLEDARFLAEKAWEAAQELEMPEFKPE